MVTLLTVLGAALLVLLGVLGAYARRRYKAGVAAQAGRVRGGGAAACEVA